MQSQLILAGGWVAHHLHLVSAKISIFYAGRATTCENCISTCRRLSRLTAKRKMAKKKLPKKIETLAAPASGFHPCSRQHHPRLQSPPPSSPPLNPMLPSSPSLPLPFVARSLRRRLLQPTADGEERRRRRRR